MADDGQKKISTGFSGLSTLVSDIEDGSPASKPVPALQPTASAPLPNAPSAPNAGWAPEPQARQSMPAFASGQSKRVIARLANRLAKQS